MGEVPTQAEWYYVGHYGQLGPLTFEQLNELARDGVVSPDTFVWKPGLGNWRPAQEVPDLRSALAVPSLDAFPPPVPGAAQRPIVPPSGPLTSQMHPVGHQGSWNYIESSVPQSDKNRVTAGLLNLLPGVGRLYLGYAAHGVLQLLTTLFCGIGFIWSVIDGIYILMGGVRYDGYGRVIKD